MRHSIIYDREQFEDYAQDFVADFPKGVVVVGDGVSYGDLRDHYRGIISYEVLAACANAEKEIDKNDENV